MSNTVWIVAAVVLVIGIPSVLAAVPGPNDPRYPDYIVNPPVVCNEEGSFPHPRNCSWFYRCVDRMKVGFFWTYHFECEPGTVFSDELDQCVHPFSAPYACKSPIIKPPPMPCEGVPGTCQEYNICYPSKINKTMCREIHCPLQRTPNLSCGDDYSFDMTTQECALIPTEAELCRVPVLTCEGVPGTCKTYDVCQPEKKKLFLCKEIICPRQAPNLNCGPDYYYDMEERSCVMPPQGADLCNFSPECEGVPGTCATHEVCKPQRKKLLLCKEIKCPGQATPSCPPDHFYDMEARTCMTPPSDAEECGANITISSLGLLPCSYDNIRPRVDFVVRKFCTEIALCSPGFFRDDLEGQNQGIDLRNTQPQDARTNIGKKYEGKTELCTGYYECEETLDGTWTAHERRCPHTMLFSFDTDKCEPEPTDEERC